MTWSLIDSDTGLSGTEVDYTGLAAYDDILVMARLITSTASGQRALRVSTNNGSSFLSASGDYESIDGAGVATDGTNIGLHVTASSAARGGVLLINAFKLANIHVADRMSRVDLKQSIIPTTSALNAIRIFDNGGGTLGGGSSGIWVYGQQNVNPWELIETRAVNGVEDFTGLSAYSELRIICDDVTSSAAGQRTLVVSTDNGSTFLTTLGDYINIQSDGTETNQSSIAFHQTGSTSARSGDMSIVGFNLSGAPKVMQRHNRTDVQAAVIPTTTALNAIRVTDTSGTPGAGTIHLLGRQ